MSHITFSFDDQGERIPKPPLVHRVGEAIPVLNADKEVIGEARLVQYGSESESRAHYQFTLTMDILVTDERYWDSIRATDVSGFVLGEDAFALNVENHPDGWQLHLDAAMRLAREQGELQGVVMSRIESKFRHHFRSDS